MYIQSFSCDPNNHQNFLQCRQLSTRNAIQVHTWRMYSIILNHPFQTIYQTIEQWCNAHKPSLAFSTNFCHDSKIHTNETTNLQHQQEAALASISFSPFHQGRVQALIMALHFQTKHYQKRTKHAGTGNQKCGFLPPINAQKDEARRTQIANTVATQLIDHETGTMTRHSQTAYFSTLQCLKLKRLL